LTPPRVLLELAVFFLRALALLGRRRSELILENLALRQQVATLQRERPHPVIWPHDRLFWVALRERWSRWTSALIIVKPQTVVRWHHRSYCCYWRFISGGRLVGRPRVDAAIRELIRKMVADNATWRGPRVHGELVKLGFDVSERTVSRYLPRRPPPRDSRQRWLTFLRNHRHALAAMDLLVVPTATFRLLYVFFIIEHGRRHIVHANATYHPTAPWVIQQLRDAYPEDSAPRYLLYDRDSTFSAEVTRTVRSLGATPVRTAYQSPWQNGVAERWVGILRRELLDHVVVLSRRQLCRLIADYVRYYHEDRTHCSLDKDTPEGRPVEPRPPTATAHVVGRSRVGGIHHRYEWRQAA